MGGWWVLPVNTETTWCSPGRGLEGVKRIGLGGETGSNTIWLDICWQYPVHRGEQSNWVIVPEALILPWERIIYLPRKIQKPGIQGTFLLIPKISFLLTPSQFSEGAVLFLNPFVSKLSLLDQNMEDYLELSRSGLQEEFGVWGVGVCTDPCPDPWALRTCSPPLKRQSWSCKLDLLRVLGRNI